MEQEGIRSRDYAMDNLRLLLIFLVVFGHLLEQFDGTLRGQIYQMIYSFHMPAFVFLNGCFARFKPEKLLKGLVLPYLVFQPLYILAGEGYFYEDETVIIQFTSPFWLTWYLLAMILYTLMIPLLEHWKDRPVPVIAVTVGLALLAGFDSTIGYEMTLSRFFVYLPFFAGGYYAGQRGTVGRLRSGRLRIPLIAAGCAGILADWFYLNWRRLPDKFLYGVLPYKALETGGPADRLALLCFALCWIAVLVMLAPNRRIPLLSALGRHTMPIYLLHGFVVYWAGKEHLFRYSRAVNGLLALLLAAGLTLCLGLAGIGLSALRSRMSARERQV